MNTQRRNTCQAAHSDCLCVLSRLCVQRVQAAVYYIADCVVQACQVKLQHQMMVFKPQHPAVWSQLLSSHASQEPQPCHSCKQRLQ